MGSIGRPRQAEPPSSTGDACVGPSYPLRARSPSGLGCAEREREKVLGTAWRDVWVCPVWAGAGQAIWKRAYFLFWDAVWCDMSRDCRICRRGWGGMAKWRLAKVTRIAKRGT